MTPQRHADSQVDIVERLPVPFGLVRYGVAPDHPEVKVHATLKTDARPFMLCCVFLQNCINQFSTLVEAGKCRFIGNTSVGKEVSLSQLESFYHAVVLVTALLREG
jgi:NADPH-dependent glutamate synthase beta subunit-like oxidoreductase